MEVQKSQKGADDIIMKRKIYQQLLDWKEKRNDPALDKEAIRVVNSMPAWNPGMKNGQPVRVKYTVPITFRL